MAEELRRQPRLQGFSLSKWQEREKALASAGHVSGANIPGNVVFATRCFFPPIPFFKGKAQQTRLELRSRAENGMLLTAGEATRIGALQPKL